MKHEFDAVIQEGRGGGAIEQTKKPETRQRRIDQAIEMLSKKSPDTPGERHGSWMH